VRCKLEWPVLTYIMIQGGLQGCVWVGKRDTFIGVASKTARPDHRRLTWTIPKVMISTDLVHPTRFHIS